MSPHVIAYLVSLGLAIASTIGDLIVTERGLAKGGQEANPVIDFIFRTKKPAAWQLAVYGFGALTVINVLPLVLSHTETGIGFATGANLMVTVWHCLGIRSWLKRG